MSSGDHDRLFSDGAAYERLMGRWSRLAGEEFISWIQAPKKLRWIDIGCGTGVFTEEIIKHCGPASVMAIDPSVDQIAFARNRTGAAKAEFRVGDGQELPFEDDSFDIAVMALVVHFLPDPSKAMAEIARVLRSGGRAATYVWDYSAGGSPTAPIVAAVKSLGFESPSPPSPGATSLGALEVLWRLAGFTELETRVIRIPVAFADFEKFWDSMTVSVGPAGKAIAKMSADHKEQLRATLQKRFPAGRQVAYEACANAIKGRLTK